MHFRYRSLCLYTGEKAEDYRSFQNTVGLRRDWLGFDMDAPFPSLTVADFHSQFNAQQEVTASVDTAPTVMLDNERSAEQM